MEYLVGHYMKPKRMHMVHNMVVNYGLYNKMDIVVNTRLSLEVGDEDNSLLS